MTKLWQKGTPLDEQIEAFTVGDDVVLDMDLVEADCLGSIGHVRTIEKAGILTAKEADQICQELGKVRQEWRDGKFTIQLADEDVHTAIENRLTDALGDLGKKVHTGRSRNDQVIACLRIWGKGALLDLSEAVAEAAAAFLDLAEKGKEWPLVGRTHMQRAMPSSVGLWAGAFAESLLDDIRLIRGAYELLDQSPLGSAASYGVPIPLDRELTAELLGFSGPQNNVLYVNNSRGKFESICLQAAAQVMLDLSKMAQDLMIWSMPEFGYFRVPVELCTGSSIMPQKRNPCGLELIRAKSASVYAAQFAVLEIARGLPSGYNRDNQETKRYFMHGLATTMASTRIAALSIEKLEVDEKKLREAFKPEVFATDEALEQVAAGKPFRDAYLDVGTNLDALGDRDPIEALKKKTSTGATGNLNLEVPRKSLEKARIFISSERKKADHIRTSLFAN